jgi:hypothetical protein
MESGRPFVERQERQPAADIGIRDVKFALTGIGICVVIAIVLMLVG